VTLDSGLDVEQVGEDVEEWPAWGLRVGRWVEEGDDALCKKVSAKGGRNFEVVLTESSGISLKKFAY
jgi:hypothetical protein